MPFKNKFSKIKDDIQKEGFNLKEKSENIYEASKITFRIKSLEEEIDYYYKRIGRKVYKKYNKGKDVEEDYKKHCKSIEKIKKEVKELEEKKLKYSDKRLCKHCGKEIYLYSDFCNHCGKEQ
ncbi:hypothetical protein [Clostridium botulinum]|uniref:hypothetical protein n=1 Tax=Clostridium botulinum TaxID=1491 RepID=UPI003DA4C910